MTILVSIIPQRNEAFRTDLISVRPFQLSELYQKRMGYLTVLSCPIWGIFKEEFEATS